MSLKLPIEGSPPNSSGLSDPNLELFFTALESPKGISIEIQTEADAKAFRHRLHRAREKARRAGNSSLDSIMIRIRYNKDDQCWNLLLEKTSQLKITEIK